MWILWIVSTGFGLTEPKVTWYGGYESEFACQKAMTDIEDELGDGEIAFCHIRQITSDSLY